MKKILIFAAAAAFAFTAAAQSDSSVNEAPVQFQDLNQPQFDDQPTNLFLMPVQYRQYNRYYRPKEPAISWLLSFLIPGVGQFYNGDIGKGFGFMGTYFLGYGLMIYGQLSVTQEANSYNSSGSYNSDNVQQGASYMLGGAVLFLTSWIWAQIDAPISASRKNRENGYSLWDTGNGGAVLTLQPTFNLTPVQLNQQTTLAPTYGAGLKLKF